MKTFTPGESQDGATVVTVFTADEKEAIRDLLANAGSVQEVEDIENAVKRGVLPEHLRQQNGEEMSASKRQKFG